MEHFGFIKELTSHQKALVIKTIRDRIQTEGRLKSSELPILLRSRLNLEWKDYARDTGIGGFKRWLLANFDVRVSDDLYQWITLTDGTPIPGPVISPQASVFQTLTPERKQQIFDLLAAHCDENGLLLLSRVAEYMLANGLSWRSFVREDEAISLREWLARNFEDIEIVNVGSVYHIRIGKKASGPPQNTDGTPLLTHNAPLRRWKSGYPVRVDIESEDSKREVGEMHIMAFMGWWNNTMKTLRDLTGYEGNDMLMWRGIVARQLALARAEGRLLDAGGDREPRFAFDTGLTTPQGQPIYMVFIKNPKNDENQVYQKWMLAGCCYPGQEGLGAWLCERFQINPPDNTHGSLLDSLPEPTPSTPIILPAETPVEAEPVDTDPVNANPVNIALADTSEDIFAQASALGQALRTACEDTARRVSEGRRADGTFAEKIAAYNDLWDKIAQQAAQVSGSVGEADKEYTLDMLKQCIEGDAERAKHAEVLAEYFEELITRVESLCRDYHWIPAENAVASVFTRDRDAVTAASALLKRDNAATEAFGRLLTPYRQLSGIMAATVLSDAQTDMLQSVCDHFSIPFRQAMRVLVDYHEVDILSPVRDIEALLEKQPSRDTASTDRPPGGGTPEKLSDIREENEADQWVKRIRQQPDAKSVIQCLDDLPEPLRGAVEDACIQSIQTAPESRIALGLYRLFGISGRKYHAQMALRFMLNHPAAVAEEALRAYAEEEANVRFGGRLSLLDVFRAVLTDETADYMLDFLKDCACLIEWRDDEITFGDRISSADRGPLSDEDGNTLLKWLFTNGEDAACWRACRELPLKEEPPVYAKLLYLYALKDLRGWEAYAQYCETNRLYEALCGGVIEWVNAASHTNALIGCHKYLLRLMEKPDALEALRGTNLARVLIGTLCDTCPVMHNRYESIRAVKTIAVRLGFEDIALERLDNDLFVKDVNLGSVMAGELLLEGRFTVAQRLIRRLNGGVALFSFRPFFNKLAQMTEEELRDKISRPSYRDVLRLMLPDGNRPAYDDTRSYAIRCLAGEKAGEGAQTLALLLEIFPDDPALYINLFLVCKEDFDGREDMLFRALNGLCLYYRRDVKVADVRDEKQLLQFTALMAFVLDSQQPDRLPFDPYDFYSEHYNWQAPPSDVLAYRQFCDMFRQTLRDATNPGQERKMITACVSGNFCGILTELSAADGDIEVLLPYVALSDTGLARSMLRVYAGQPEGSRSAFFDWMNRQAGNPRKLTTDTEAYTKIHAAWQTAYKLYEDCESSGMNPERLTWALRYLIEEKSIFRTTYEEMTTNPGDDIFPRLLLLGALAYADNSADLIQSKAYGSFASFADTKAFTEYRALTRLNRHYNVYAQRPYKEKTLQYEHNEAMQRLSGAFAGDDETLKKISSTEFHAWSCANMVTQLLVTPRANELHRLRRLLSPENQRLCCALYDCFNANLTDEEKLERVESFADRTARSILYYVLRFDRANLYYLKDAKNKKTAHDRFEQYALNESWPGDKRSWHTVNVPKPAQIKPQAWRLIPVERWENADITSHIK